MTALAAGPVQDALGDVARFVPKLILFLIILALGWLAARLLRAGASRLLRRVGFDQAVERGGVGRVLAYGRYDARSLITALVYYAVLLFTLQLAFGIWGPNPVSDLIAGILAWLPRAFVAIVIVVVASAVAAGVRNLINGALGAWAYGRLLAHVAGAFLIGIGIIAALDQIGVATSVTTPVLVAILATVGGILVVGVGGGMVRPMQTRWESWLSRAEQELPRVREQLRVAAEEREAARREAEARAAAEREEAARREAEARAEAERAEAERREQAAREAAEAEARAAAEAEARAAAEAEARAAAEAAAEREEAARREAEAQRAREAERQQAARDEAARIEAEREEAAKQDVARAEAARQEVTRREADQAEAAREAAVREEAAAVRGEAAPDGAAQATQAKKRTSRPRTARERAEQAAAHRAAAEAGTLPQAPPSDEPTVAIDVSKLRGATTGSGQDAEETQRITVPVADAGDDPERTQVISVPEPEQQATPSTTRRRRPQGGTTK